jgi:hypothetical protein
MADPVEVKQRKRHLSIAALRAKVFLATTTKSETAKGGAGTAATSRRTVVWLTPESTATAATSSGLTITSARTWTSWRACYSALGAGIEWYVDNAKIYHAKALTLSEEAMKSLRSNRSTTMVEV